MKYNVGHVCAFFQVRAATALSICRAVQRWDTYKAHQCSCRRHYQELREVLLRDAVKNGLRAIWCVGVRRWLDTATAWTCGLFSTVSDPPL